MIDIIIKLLDQSEACWCICDSFIQGKFMASCRENLLAQAIVMTNFGEFYETWLSHVNDS